MEAGGGRDNGENAGEAAADAEVIRDEELAQQQPVIIDGAEAADAAGMQAPGVDWDDRLSWEDSERFEEDSLCSWLSDPESLVQNWRGWSADAPENGTLTTGHHSNPSGGHGGADMHGSGSGGIISAAGAASSHRHHTHHSNSGRGGGCSSPSAGHHHLMGASSLNYNGGLSTVGQSPGAHVTSSPSDGNNGPKVFTLVEMTAREVARSVPFELVERFYPPVPETLQLRVAFWSFPENEEDIRLYSCLANGNVDEFQKGEQLYRNGAVKDLLQIGFHLSGVVSLPSLSGGGGGNVLSAALSMNRREASNSNSNRYSHHHSNWTSNSHNRSTLTSAINPASPQSFNVAVTLDRRRITSCTCTCRPPVAAAWCAHVVAVCLHRIHQPQNVCLRAPVSESLSRLQRDQLQKFAQYLISELPRQILPTAQRLLDDLLSQTAPINTVCGAPDPTAGASINETSWWCLDDPVLHENIRKILVKFCQPSPTVFSDVNYLSSSAPPAATEWQALMRPLRGREPEGLWNLLSIVREMYKRRDSNAAKLLRIITTECLNCDQVVVWWYHTKVSQSLNGPHLLPNSALVLASASSSAGAGGGKSNNGGGGTLGGQTYSAQYSCASLLDEIVVLWRLLILNPCMSPDDRQHFAQELRFYHTKAIEKIYRILGGGCGTVISAGQQRGQNQENGQNGGGVINNNGHNHHHHHHHHSQHHHGGGQHHHHHHHHHASALNIPSSGKLTGDTARFDAQTFPGFLPAVAACLIDWADYPIDGVTYEPTRGRSPSYGSACGYLTLKEFGNGQQCTSTTPAALSPSTAEGVSGVPVLRDKQYQNLSMLKTKEASSVKEEKMPTAAEVDVVTPKSTKLKSNAVVVYDEIDRLYLPEAQAQDDRVDEAAAVDAGEEKNNAAMSASSTQQLKRRTPADWVDEVFRSLTTVSDEVEILSARCESLHAHGYRKEAVKLAAQLATRLMQNPPVLLVDVPVVLEGSLHGPNAKNAPFSSTGPATRAATSVTEIVAGTGSAATNKNSVGHLSGGRKKKKAAMVSQTSSSHHEAIFVHPRAMEVSQLASITLARATFLFSVLAEDTEYRPLAFQIGLWALELPRQPAATKFLEVKMHYQESEIVGMLRQLPLAAEEMESLRQRAHRLRTGFYHHHHHAASAPAVNSSNAGVGVGVSIPNLHTKLIPAVLPLSLAGYIFESLSWPSPSLSSATTAASANQLSQHRGGGGGSHGQQQQKANAYRAPGDEQLAFESAVAALAMKSNVSEAEHPLLCEGIRRQKGDLGLALLLRYRDQQEKLAVIMDRLLDHEMHQMYKHHSSNAVFYGHYVKNSAVVGATSSSTNFNASTATSTTSSSFSQAHGPSSGGGTYQQASPYYRHQFASGTGADASDPSSHHSAHQRSTTGATDPGSPLGVHHAAAAPFLQRSFSGVASPGSSLACFDEVDSDSAQNNTCEVSQLSETLDDMALLAAEDEEEYDLDDDTSARGDGGGSPFWMAHSYPRQNGSNENGNATGNASKAVPENVANAKPNARSLRQEGSLSDEAASAISTSTAVSTSDDSSSSGISTRGDGKQSPPPPSNAGQAAAAALNRSQRNDGNGLELEQAGQRDGTERNGTCDTAAPAPGVQGLQPRPSGSATTSGNASAPRSVDPLNKACYVKLNRHRRYVTPSIPNQPSEAHAHFIMELAKRLLIEAGGSHSTAIFTSQGNGPQANQGHGGGPHRQLHLCAFQIGLYSLGIHNKVTPNWLSRTYSSHVSWISGNAMEIGRTAIRILIDTWENHLTPTEAATLADKASQSRDPGMIQAAAELALSTLPQAHALNPTEIFRALAQCKEQPTTTMLEKACLAVEQAAKDYGVYPEVLFRVAQTWYQLYLDSTATAPGLAAEHHHHHQQQQQQALIGHFGEPPQQQTQPPQQPSNVVLQPHFVQHRTGIDVHPPPGHHVYAGHNHHHHAYGNNIRHHMTSSPAPTRPQVPPLLGHSATVAACQPPSTLLQHQQQHMAAAAAAAYGLQHQFLPSTPSGLAYLPSTMLRPPSSASGTGGSPAVAVVHHAATPPYQSHHHPPQLPGLHHPPPPPAQQVPPPPPQGPIGGLPLPVAPNGAPYFQQAAAALMNAYHHNPYAAAQFAAAAAAAAAVSRNYAVPLMQQQQLQQRGGQQQLMATQTNHNPPSANYHLAQASAQGQQHQHQAASAAERHVDQAGGQSRYLYAAYRVGMLALETLGRRINDDRAFTKYSQNPTYGDDVKWLLKISKRLGLMYVQQFCLVAAQSVPSPFVLWDLASEVAMLFSRSTTSGGSGVAGLPLNPVMVPSSQANAFGGMLAEGGGASSGTVSTLGSQAHQMAAASMNAHPPAALFKALMHPHVQPLVQRCLQMFYAAAQQKLSHPRFMPADTEEVCALVKAARTAFLHTPGGPAHFNEFLQSLRRQKACKKDVWNKILSHLNG